MVEELDAAADVGLEVAVVGDPVPGQISRPSIDRSGSAAAISRASRTPATSGGDVLGLGQRVRRGSAASPTGRPSAGARARGCLRRDQHRPERERVPVVLLEAVVDEVRRARSGTGGRARAGRAGCGRRRTPRRRSRSAARCGAAATRAAAWACRRRRATRPSTSQMQTTYGMVLEVLADARAGRAATVDADRAQLRRRARSRRACSSCGEPNAPALRITSRSARGDLLAPAPVAEAHARRPGRRRGLDADARARRSRPRGWGGRAPGAGRRRRCSSAARCAG